MDKDFLKKFEQKLKDTVYSVKEARMDDDRRRLMSTVGQDIANVIAPFLKDVAQSSSVNKDNLKEAMAEVMGTVTALSPTIDTTPIITAIEQAMGNIYIPEPKVTVTIPEIKLPKIEMPEEMEVKGWLGMMGYDRGLLENPLPVQLRDAKGKPLDFAGFSSFVSGGGKGDYFTIKGFSASAFSEMMNPDGRVKVELPTGSSGLTDTELRASHLDVQQVSGAVDSTNVLQFGGDALAKGEEVNVGFLRVHLAQNARYSVDATLSGALTSAVVVGPVVADSADDGNAPVQVGGVARQANPTAVAANDIVKATFDDLGRQVMRPVQVRDLIATAYATVTNVTETTLLGGASGVYHDLIFVKFSNQSSAAVNVALRSSTAGTIVDTFSIPANGTVGYAPKVPLPPNEIASAWTFQNTASDDSTTTIAVSGLFSKEV